MGEMDPGIEVCPDAGLHQPVDLRAQLLIGCHGVLHLEHRVTTGHSTPDGLQHRLGAFQRTVHHHFGPFAGTLEQHLVLAGKLQHEAPTAP